MSKKVVKKSGSRTRQNRVVWEYFESLIIAVVIALFLRAFVLAAFKIPTGSMSPTLKAGDLIFAWKFPYSFRIPGSRISLVEPKMPKRGDVVVFRYPEDENLSFVKRVVGLPGDTIQIRQKRLFVNGKIAAYSPADKKLIEDLPLKNVSIVESETFADDRNKLGHYVMFRRGEDDDAYGPTVVPPKQFFVLGDNRDSSDDSRYWGMVPLDNLEGRAFLIWFSLDWENRFKNTAFPMLRVERIFSLIR